MLHSLFVGVAFGIDQMGRALDATHMSNCHCMRMQSRVPIPDTVLPSEKGQFGPETVPLPVLTCFPLLERLTVCLVCGRLTVYLVCGRLTVYLVWGRMAGYLVCRRLTVYLVCGRLTVYLVCGRMAGLWENGWVSGV